MPTRHPMHRTPARPAMPVLAAVLLIATAPLAASAADLPKRKSGLWQLTMGAKGEQAAQMCIDRNTDDMKRQIAGAGIPCSKQEIRREGARYVFDSVCRIGESTATTRAVFTGKFDSSYRVDIHAKYAPPLMDMREGSTTITATWLGPCRSGQRPGDLILGNGVTINVFDAPKPAPKPK